MSAFKERMSGWFAGLRQPVDDVLPVRLGGTRRFATGSTPTNAKDFDQALIWVTVTLLAWGLVMVYSASIAMPENPRFSKYTPTYFFYRHMMWLCISFFAALVA